MEFATYTAYLTFTWVASTAALLGVVKNYKDKDENRG